MVKIIASVENIMLVSTILHVLCAKYQCISGTKKTIKKKKNRMDPIFIDRCRDKLFTFLCECFVINEPSLACFFWTFSKIYDSEGNTQQDVSLPDLDKLL